MALPPGLRNRLAELILEAFEDPEARARLADLAAFCADDGRLGVEAVERLGALGWFEPGPAGALRLAGAHRAHRATLCRRVAAAHAMHEGHPPPPTGAVLPDLLTRAARLADVGLYFEVHELLEPAWFRAAGDLRLALQGLIQVAVALHHADQGNREGAGSLLGEGLAKLGATRGVLPLETAEWEAGLAAALAALHGGAPIPASQPWPRPRETAWRSS